MMATLLVTLRAPPTPSIWRRLGVRAAVGGQDHPVAKARVRRQVLFVEKESLAGAAAHENSRYASAACRFLLTNRFEIVPLISLNGERESETGK